MATAIVFPPSTEKAAPGVAGSIDLTFDVAYSLDNGVIDMHLVSVNVASGETPAVLMGRVSAAVTARATQRGYSVPKSAITILSSFSKG